MRWLLVALGIAGCNPIEELPPDQVCKDVGYSIANRTQDCTGDLDLTRARLNQLQASYNYHVALASLRKAIGQADTYVSG